MNKLEQKLGLNHEEPWEYIWDIPTANNLKFVPKAKQTFDMLRLVCEKDGLALKYASKKLITTELCEIAVEQNGRALKYVPSKIIEEAGSDWEKLLYETAVANKGDALEYVPEKLKNESLVELAVSNGGGDYYYYLEKSPIAFVPAKLLSNELLLKSVGTTPFSIKDIPNKKITKELALLAVKGNGQSLQYIPQKYYSKDLVWIAVSNSPTAIRYAPRKLINQEICDECFRQNPASLSFFPADYITEKMCIKTVSCCFSIERTREKVAFEDFPEPIRNSKQVLDVIMREFSCDSSSLLEWNEEIIKKWDQQEYGVRNRRGETVKPLQKKTVGYLKSKQIENRSEASKDNLSLSLMMEDDLVKYVNRATLPLPNEIPQEACVVSNHNGIYHYLSEETVSTTKVYYITDLHLEHQLAKWAELIAEKEKTHREVFLETLLTQKIQEMLSDVDDRSSLLLIGGDVADSIGLSAMFYRLLLFHWNGTVISVLGNHELWDGTVAINPQQQTRQIEVIVEDYKNSIEHFDRRFVRSSTGLKRANCKLLENALYINYENIETRVIDEDTLLESSEEELTDLLSKCTTIILGGIGYSGLNPVYNATMGLYRNALKSLEEDRYRAGRFASVYEKVRACASDKKVIVLTHTPVYDWTTEPYVPNWIYVNGHTHQNSLTKTEDGTTVLSDNQIGYEPKRWTLNFFTLDGCWYDPFEHYEDGIYPISSKEYRDFNRGRGIMNWGCNYEGQLYMLKRADLYMFVLQSSKSLCLMSGGARKRLARRNIQYYFDHMVEYREAVLKTIEPYQMVLRRLSEEVKRFGGSGIIHGCIVDISFLSHIYVNPFDGQLTPYWALDILSRNTFDNIQMLIESKEPEMLNKFLLCYNENSIPLIGKNMMPAEKHEGLAVIPKWVFGTDIYNPSRMMRAVQYVWEQNVIRIWNDSLLEEDENALQPPLIN